MRPPFRRPCAAPRAPLVVLFACAVTAVCGPASAAAQEFADAGGDITMALAGDAIITRAMSPFSEPEFLELVERIREATVGFVNLEVLFHDYGPEIIPAAASGGTYMAARPELARELAWMGFDMVSRANNHTMDYGIGGMRATTAAVEAAGLAHAGAGENLALSRAPAYVETPGGRVALISVASTFDDAMRAGAQRKDLRGRPGLSPVRYERTYVLDPPGFRALRALAASMGRDLAPDADTVRLLRQTFVAGEESGVRTSPHAGDLAEIEAVIRDAKRQANWVIVSSHSHEGAASRAEPAEFLVTFARATIDAGADVFVGHGPHVLRGIEIHNGRPIFYSLGDFIFQNETVELQPADNYEPYDLPAGALPSDFYDTREARSDGGFPADPAYWEAVVAVPVFRDGALHEVRLHPITLGHGLPRPQRGRPVLAEGARARSILERLARLSTPFGTPIEVRGGVGIVRVR